MENRKTNILIQGAFIALFIFCLEINFFAQTKSPTLSETDRIRLAEAFRLEETFADKVWKDWRKVPLSTLLVTPENEFLIRHSAPSKDFTETTFDKTLKSRIYFRKKVFNQTFLATFPAISGSGISTIIVGQAENTWVKNSTPWVLTILHEHFHQLQDSQPNIYQEISALGLANGDETGMWMLNYPFPYEDKTLNENFSKLGNQLAKTLETNDKNNFQNELKTYLKMRTEFNAQLKPNDYKYLSFQLWKEGVARYTEYRIAVLASEKYKPNKDFAKLNDFETYKSKADEIYARIIYSLKNHSLKDLNREVAYPFGAGEALLLDKAGIDWKNRYWTEKFYLEKYFETAK